MDFKVESIKGVRISLPTHSVQFPFQLPTSLNFGGKKGERGRYQCYLSKAELKINSPDSPSPLLPKGNQRVLA